MNKAPFTLLRFCTKTERKTSVFVKVFTLICTKRHKDGGFGKRCQKWISTKTEVFGNAFDQCEHTKTEVFENAPICNNELHKTEQCERTKTDVSCCVFVIGQISVNAQKRRFFSPFLYENGAV